MNKANLKACAPQACKDWHGAAQAAGERAGGQNKSAVIADLMREAVQRAQARQQHVSAIDRILARRAHTPSVTEAQFQAAREEGRA